MAPTVSQGARLHQGERLPQVTSSDTLLPLSLWGLLGLVRKRHSLYLCPQATMGLGPQGLLAIREMDCRR